MRSFAPEQLEVFIFSFHFYWNKKEINCCCAAQTILTCFHVQVYCNCTLILNLNVKKDSHEINQSKFSVFLLVGRGGEVNLLSKSC